MDLDPQIQVMLDQTAALGAGSPPVHEQPVAQQRLAYDVFGGLGARPDTVDTEEHTLDGPGGPIRLRVYRPLLDPPVPGLLYLHAGGFVIGSLDSHDSVCRLLADSAGSTVVAVDYRRAPEHPYPGAHQDADAALSWVAARADELGIDPDRLAVGGDSAGGNLATSVALIARDRGGDPPVAAQLLVYPWVDLACDRPSLHEFEDGFLLTRASLEQWRTMYAPEGRWDRPELSPIYADVDGLPPAIVVTAGYDPLRDQGHAYADHLRAAGVEVHELHFPDLVHTFVQVTAVSDRARAATEEMARRLASLLS